MAPPPTASDPSAEKLGQEASQTRSGQGSSLSTTLLQDYTTHLDPLDTGDLSAGMDETKLSKDVQALQASSKTHDVAQTPTKPSHASPPRALPSRNSLLRQPMKPPPAPLGPHRSMLRSLASRTSQENLRSDRPIHDRPPPGTSFTARLMHAPCFFHQRFEDAVNVDRVLEEIAAGDDGISHSRLMQTATSVREISKQLQRRPIKRAVRTVMIITKARDNKLVFLTRALAEWLLKTPRYSSDLGVAVYVDAKLRNSKRFDAAGLVASDPRFEHMLNYWTPDLCTSSPEKFDLVLTLGGDGTVLYTSWLFQRIVPPILSFSLGTLGFLTNFTFSDYKSTLEGVMAGMRVNMRMRFTCTVYRSRTNNLSSKASSTTNLSSLPATHKRTCSTTSNSTSTSSTPVSTTAASSATSFPSSITSDAVPERSFEVLNELVLDRGPSPYVSNLELYGDKQLLTIIQADGIIISTPTGSTAYSLSAGGPLTHPSIPGILLTPICPHTLSFRPMVLSDTLMLRLVVPRHSRGGAYASFDGKGRVELRRGDEVRVEVGRYPFPTVVGEGGTGEEWFDSVRRALRWNTRGAVQGELGRRVGMGDEAEDAVVEEERSEGKQDVDEVEEWDIDAEPLNEEEWGGSVGGSVKGAGSEAGSVAASPSRRAAPTWGLD